VSFGCLFYADDIVLLCGSLYKLQLMLNICDVEMRSLDLKFNPLKCHVLRVGKNYDNACNNVLPDNCAIAFEDSITYLGTLIRAGRTWRTDSSPRRRQCFRAFNSIFCSLLICLNLLSNIWLNLFVCQYCCIILMLLVSPNRSVLRLSMLGI